MVFHSGDLEINPVGYRYISSSLLNTKRADVAQGWIKYEIFICREDGTSDPNLEAR